MKHQYFGDHRDLFMFDLVLEILSKTGLRQLTYIPMLTRDNDSEYVLRMEAEGPANVRIQIRGSVHPRERSV